MLNKADFDNKDSYLAFLEHKNTPLSNNIPSPSELLCGHEINGIMPLFSQLINMTRLHKISFLDKN